MKHYKDPVTGELFAYEADGSQDAFIKEGLVPVTNPEADQLRAQKGQEYFDMFSYDRKRSTEYPSIGDQLDALFHAGIYPAEMAARIQAIKDKYPKPN
jgi:hypothetical protein